MEGSLLSRGSLAIGYFWQNQNEVLDKMERGISNTGNLPASPLAKRQRCDQFDDFPPVRVVVPLVALMAPAPNESTPPDKGVSFAYFSGPAFPVRFQAVARPG